MGEAIVHRHESTAAGVPVNAYLVEGDQGIVAIDGTLTVSGGRDLRRQADALGKPLLAVLITHSHPDHYAGGPYLAAVGGTERRARIDSILARLRRGEDR